MEERHKNIFAILENKKKHRREKLASLENVAPEFELHLRLKSESWEDDKAITTTTTNMHDILMAIDRRILKYSYVIHTHTPIYTYSTHTFSDYLFAWASFGPEQALWKWNIVIYQCCA